MPPCYWVHHGPLTWTVTAGRIEAFQRVKIKSGKVHLLRRARNIQARSKCAFSPLGVIFLGLRGKQAGYHNTA